MNPPDVYAGQWKVDVRSSGEILTAAATEPSIELGLLGLPAGYSPAEITGWLHDLIGVARETGRNDARPRPIPTLLHHGLTGLLFSHAQLWNREGGRPPVSYAIVRVEGVLAFGWIGDASIVARVDGAPAQLREIIVRDEEGREARAFELPDADAVELRMECAADESGRPQAVLEARWPGAAAAQAEIDAAAGPAAGALAASGSEHPAAAVDPADEPFLDAFAALEVPHAPHPAADVSTPPMEGLEREAFSAPTAEDHSFLDDGGEPLDLGAHASAAPDPALETSAPSPAAAAAGEDPDAPEPAFTSASAMPAHVSAAVEAPDAVTPAAPADASRTPQFTAAAAAEAGRAAAPAVGLDAPETAEQESRAVTVLDTEEGPDDDAPEHSATGGEEEPRPSRLRRMFARFAFWRRGDDETASPHDVPFEEAGEAAPGDLPGLPEQVPPSPESAELTAKAIGDYAAAAPPPDDGNEVLVGTDVPPAEATAAGTPDPHAAEQGPGPGAPIHEVLEPHAAAIGTGEATDAPIETAPADAGAEDALEPHAAAIEAGTAMDASIEPVPAQQELAVVADATAAVLEPHGIEPAATAAAEQTGEAPQGAPARTPMRPQWPTEEELRAPAPLWKRPWAWGVLMAALFAGGWIIGHMNDESRAGAARGMRNVLRTVGLGGAHFEVMVNSRPPGAWISVDGEDLARRTPASVELEPGEHQVTLSFSDLGAATFNVRGADGDRLALDPPLWGSLQIYPSDQEVPVAVTVDGVTRGFAPLRVDSLQPGAHEVRFSGPGLPSWGQTVQVRINESADLVARPMTSPATGLIEVRASMTTGAGIVDVEGAKVWLDSEPAGETPLTLELPRGPHSIRVEHLGETAPVQVIDLPGGNQRFASFQLRDGQDFATLVPLDPPAEIPLDQPTVVSVALEGVPSTDVREMWLHVQTPDGSWRRYQMAWLKSTGGVVGVVVFPTTLFDTDGRVRYYSSASTQSGDEYFSEVHVAVRPGAGPARAAAQDRR